MTTPQLRRPAPPSNFTSSEHVGEVCLVVNGGYHPRVSTKEFGVKPAGRVTVVLLTGPRADNVYEDVMLFGGQSSQFRDWGPGEVGAARIVQKGKSVIWGEPSPYDEDMATRWMVANGPRLDQLRADIVRVFREKAVELDAAMPAPTGPTQPQWTNPEARPGDQPLPGMGVRDSLRRESQPADPDETGY